MELFGHSNSRRLREIIVFRTYHASCVRTDFVMVTFLIMMACGTAEQPSVAIPSIETQPNVIFVTLDTVRTDAVGVYGGPDGITPTIDAIAAKGVRFDWAFSHAPTTLASHSSMFTGLDTHGHGVPRNGFPLSDSHTTIFETLQEVGYDTIGVVAASVLGADMGIAQGFRLYDDEVRTDMGRRYEDRGDRVTRRARRLISQRDESKPLALWVHYYDAHSPYTAPSDYQARFVNPDHEITQEAASGHAILADWIRAGSFPDEQMQWLIATYHAEVAWVDHQIDRLFDSLEADGLLENSLIVITADHGEMFGEQADHPLGHGFEVDAWASRVPLIIARTGESYQAPVVTQPVKQSDIANTIMSMLGLPVTLGTGQDLTPLMAGESLPGAPIFLEATKPAVIERSGEWNNQQKERGVVVGDRIYIESPLTSDEPTLYQLLDSGGVMTQQAIGDDPQGQSMGSLLSDWRGEAPEFRDEQFSVETESALRALGYLD
jgi:arylsulfatase A-like enzyme